jgi:hypothetical protein
VVLAGFALTGCQSTQDKAKALEELAAEHAPKPLVIGKENKDVEVLDTTLLSDQNGDAVVVTLKNEGEQPEVNVPILVDLRAGKKSLYANDVPGLETALNHVPLIKPGETLDWVNDQLSPVSKPDDVKVKLGEPETPAPAQLPEVEIGDAKIEDTSLGPKVEGRVTNKSQIDQLQLVVFAVARSGDRIVAAGRGGIKKLKAGSTRPFSSFFIGDPAGGDLTVTTAPTTFK